MTKERDLFHENYIEFGKAIQDAGGNPFLILERHKEFIQLLASNNITITAKYDFSKRLDDRTLLNETRQP